MPKTIDQFLAAWSDELTGLLLDAFAESQRGQPVYPPKTDVELARQGRYFVQQLKRARDLLTRIHAADVKPPEPPKPEPKAPVNGVLTTQGVKRT